MKASAEKAKLNPKVNVVKASVAKESVEKASAVKIKLTLKENVARANAVKASVAKENVALHN